MTSFKIEGFQQLIPYFTVKGADDFIRFLVKAFGAQEINRHTDGDKNIRYALLKIGDSALEVSEARPEYPPMQLMLHLYLEDVDETHRAALGAGAISLMEPAQMYYGERGSGVRDPWGNQWYLATRNEEVSWSELEERAKAHAH